MVTLERILQKVMIHISDTAAVKAVKLALDCGPTRRISRAEGSEHQSEPVLEVQSSESMSRSVSMLNKTSKVLAPTQATELALDLSKTEVRISNTLVCGHINVGPPAHQCDYHLYYSVHDHNIKDVIEKMRAELKDGARLRVTCDWEKFDRAHQMIVFLNSETNFSDDDKLLAELRRGLNRCVHAGRDPATYFVLVHETRCALLLGRTMTWQHAPVPETLCMLSSLESVGGAA